MILIKPVLLFFLISFSSASLADTYPAISGYKWYGSTTVYSSQSSTCEGAATWRGAGYTSVYNNGYCNIKDSTGYLVDYFQPSATKYCPAGGTLSGSDCVNAPACLSGEIRDPVSGACGAPPPPTCPSPIPMCTTPAMVCQGEGSTTTSIPECAVICPDGTHHDSSTGNPCVPDVQDPTSCPAGFTDNGQGGCSPNASPCEAGQRHGTVNGETTCVSSSENTSPSDTPPSSNTATATGTNTSTTEHKDANGNVTGTSTTTGTSTQQISIDTTGLAHDSTVKGVLDAVVGLGKGTQNEVGLNTAGEFDISVPTAAALTAKGEFQSEFNSVKTQINQLINFSSGGGGSLPVVEYGSIKGVSVSANLSRYAEQLNPVGLAVMFLAAFVSVRIFLD